MKFRRKIVAVVFAIGLGASALGACASDGGGSNCASGVRRMVIQPAVVEPAVIKRGDRGMVIKRGDRSTRPEPGGARRGVACSAGQKFR